MLNKLKVPLFNLSDEEKEIFEIAIKFAQEINDVEIDKLGLIPDKLFESLSRGGFFGIGYPKEYGGSYISETAIGLVILAISYKCASTGIVLSVHNSLVGAILNKYLTDYQKSVWLPSLASGKCISCFCLSEPEAGSDVRGIRTKLILDGNDYILEGEKSWVTNGPYAIVGLVFAKYNDEITAVLVDLNSNGVKKHTPEEKLGIKGAQTCSISFDGVRINRDQVVGEFGSGLKLALYGLNHGRLGVACQSLGIGWRAFYEAFNYSLNRKAFGQVILNYQFIQDYLADMRTKLDHATAYTFLVLANPDRSPRECSEAKLYASTVANDCAYKAIQIFGGNGYVKDFVVERLFRDARITTIYEGSSEIQKLNIIRFLQKELV